MLKVISYSLFGNEPMYLQGVMNNVKLWKKYYPDWEMWVYTDGSSDDSVLVDLEELGVNVIYVDEPNDGRSGTFWRFRAAEHADITLFRDLDSKINEREVRMVNDWLENTDKRFHVIRDVSWHTTPIQAGMWGVRGKIPMFSKIIDKWENKHEYGQDEKFLEAHVWSLGEGFICQHDNWDHYFPSRHMPFEPHDFSVGIKGSKTHDITIVSHYDNKMADVGDVSGDMLLEYANRHGYNYHQYYECYKKTGRHPSWSKIPIIQSNLKNSDWIVAVDADIAILDYTKPLQQYLQEMVEGHKAIMTGKDFNGLNCGLIAVQTHHPMTREILDVWWAVGDVANDEEYGYGPKWEQNALKALRKEFRSITAATGMFTKSPMHTFNEPDYPWTIFRHFPMMDNTDRLKLMTQVDKEAKK